MTNNNWLKSNWFKNNSWKMLLLTPAIAPLAIGLCSSVWIGAMSTASSASALTKASVNLAADKESSWSEFSQVMERKKKDLGSRGDICPIAPTPGRPTQMAEVWHLQPKFVWKGNMVRMAIVSQEANQEPWHYAVPAVRPLPPYMSAEYTGAELKPGVVYAWQIFGIAAEPKSNPAAVPTLQVKFRVMAAAQRSVVEKQLQALEAELKAKQTTPEMIAQKRAIYFAERGLLVDALQEALSVNQPSVELQKAIAQIAEKSCKTSPKLVYALQR